MFDVGFLEIVIIAAVALVILGPERLPRAARTAGLWVGRARRMVAEVKTDIDREIRDSELADMRKLGEEVVEAAVAVLSGSGEELVGEAADILFHLIIALNARDVPLADVLAELDRREGVSGIEEKASRSA